jgi:hypothetical protein
MKLVNLDCWKSPCLGGGLLRLNICASFFKLLSLFQMVSQNCARVHDFELHLSHGNRRFDSKRLEICQSCPSIWRCWWSLRWEEDTCIIVGERLTSICCKGWQTQSCSWHCWQQSVCAIHAVEDRNRQVTNTRVTAFQLQGSALSTNLGMDIQWKKR